MKSWLKYFVLMLSICAAIFIWGCGTPASTIVAPDINEGTSNVINPGGEDLNEGTSNTGSDINIGSTSEAFRDTLQNCIDTDRDEICNEIDPDIDNDGLNNSVDNDIDGDGIDNIDDNDIDGDGIVNTEDNDIDGDGIINIEDEDIDGDGIININDNDTDGDGIINTEDEDIDGDGVINLNDPDIDNDGILNINDIDIDGDGIINIEDEDIDGDGIINLNDPDIDGDGIVNEEDTDIDGDGIINIEDPDVDNDGIPNDQDTDDDGDGIPDSSDPTPQGNEGGSTQGGPTATATYRDTFNIEIVSGETEFAGDDHLDLDTLRADLEDDNIDVQSAEIDTVVLRALPSGYDFLDTYADVEFVLEVFYVEAGDTIQILHTPPFGSTGVPTETLGNLKDGIGWKTSLFPDNAWSVFSQLVKDESVPSVELIFEFTLESPLPDVNITTLSMEYEIVAIGKEL
jgi:hypothetical protein